MSKDTTKTVWILAVVAAGLCGYFDFGSHLTIWFVPAVALVFSGMVLSDAMAIRRTGICVMRDKPTISRDADAEAFATQLRLEYGMVAFTLLIAIASQIDIAWPSHSLAFPIAHPQVAHKL